MQGRADSARPPVVEHPHRYRPHSAGPEDRTCGAPTYRRKGDS